LGIVPDTATLKEVEELYNQGLYLQAYGRARHAGGLEDWTGVEARLLAARLFCQLGGFRRGYASFLRIWRDHPDHPAAVLNRARVMLWLRGTLTSWEIMRSREELDTSDPDLQAEWLSLRAHLAACLRDFYSAERLLARAESLAPASAWVLVERSFVMEQEDRYQECLEVAAEALRRTPWHRPGVRAYASALRILDRHGEAAEFLAEADRRLESCWITGDLAEVELHLDRNDRARLALERFAELTPLADKAALRWMAGIRYRLAHDAGDYAEAAVQCLAAGGKYHRELAANLRSAAGSAGPDGGGSGRRVLPIGFVRQHYVTCAPATLAVLARYWEMPSEHLDIAQDICYDGTSSYSERHWAETHGWAVREFDLTWPAAVELIDRGVPFALTTVAPDNAHLQAVIGYDARKRTLVVRDPYLPDLSEPLVGTLLREQASCGPRCTAMIPEGRRGLLDGLELPGAALYDRLYLVNAALAAHDWKRAWNAYQGLAAEAPDHHVELQARRAIAAYDVDSAALLECAQRHVRLFPECRVAKIGLINRLNELGRREERLQLLREECRRRDSHPAFWWRLADDLRTDAREHAEALRFAKRAIRICPGAGRTYHILADILWDRRKFSRALELYRFAACLDDKDEHNALSFFRASRQARRTEEALDFLRARFARFGRRSGAPAVTMCGALEELERVPEGLRGLDRAMLLRPDDGELMLHSARAYGRHGEAARAVRLLHRARGRVARGAWLQVAAELSRIRGKPRRALRYWRRLLHIQPLNIEAHRQAAILLAESGGIESAIAHLREAAERFPHNCALHRLWVEWLRERDPAEQERVLRRLLDINPAEAWARRELSLVLGRLGRGEESLAAAEAAMSADPDNPFSRLVRGLALEQLGRLAEAQESLRQAVRISVDCELAIDALLRISPSLTELREHLELVRGELERQTIYGEGLLAFRRHASGILGKEELLEVLRNVRQNRPDLWHAWSALTLQLLETDDLDGAMQNAEEACRRFPLLPRLRLDRASVCRARMEDREEMLSLERALELSPGWGQAAIRLSAAYRRAGRIEDARRAIARTWRHCPLDGAVLAEFSEVLWALGEKEAAVERATSAARLAPGLGRIWSNLSSWCAQLGRAAEPVRLARELIGQRPGEAETWLGLAKALRDPGDRNERMAALDRVLAIDPRHVEARDLKATWLAEQGRYEEALRVCSADGLTGPHPPQLRATAACVEAARGNLTGAIARMEEVVSERPDYQWAWQQLAEWYQKSGDKPGQRRAGERLAELAPHDPLALAYRADGRLADGDRAGARADLRRANSLDPDYEYAGNALFDLLMEDGETKEAEAVISRLEQRRSESQYVLSRAARLDARSGRPERALERLEKLVSKPGCAASSLRGAWDAVRLTMLYERQEEVLRSWLARPNAHPEVSGLLSSVLAVSSGFRRGRELLDSLRGRPAAWARAAVAYLNAAADREDRWAIHLFLLRNRRRARADDAVWGTVGYALSCVKSPRRIRRWMWDWRIRKGVRPWMLTNLADAFRQLGRGRQAREVHEYALALPADHASDCHRTWLALDLAAEGRCAEANAELHKLAGADLGPYFSLLRELAEATLEVLGAQPGTRAEALELAGSILSRTARGTSDHDRVMSLARRRCMRTMARAVGGRRGLALTLRAVFGR
jgi:tetratricopeptide (TPR) repeat protein